MHKLNINTKVDNAAKKKMVASNEIGTNETLLANEVNQIVAKANELVDAYNFMTPIKAFNYKTTVPTYADLPNSGNEINDGYGVQSDGLVYVWNGEAFPADGDGMDLKLRPDGKVDETDPMAVSGMEVFRKTATLTHGKNFIDKDHLLSGKFINEVTGKLDSNANYSATEDFIKVTESTSYIMDYANRIAYYSAPNEDSFLSAEVMNIVANEVRDTPVGTNYIRASFSSSGLDGVYFGLNDEYDGYKPYEKIIPENIQASEVTPSVKDGIKYDVAKVVESFVKNRIDPSEIISGKYVNANNGRLNDNPNYKATGFIYVGDLSHYVVSPYIVHIAKYSALDENSFIGGGEWLPSNIVTRGAEQYIKLSYEIGQTNMQLEGGTVATSYEPFKVTIKLQQKDKLYDLAGNEVKKDDKPIVALPNNIYLAPALQYNFYHKNLFVSDFGFDELKIVDINAPQGRTMSKKYRLLGTENGSIGVNFKAYRDGSLAVEKQITFHIAEITTGDGITRKILVLGDSTINQEVVVDSIKEGFADDVMSVIFLGTKQTGAGTKHEGRSGWTIDNYYQGNDVYGVTNPFYNPSTTKFDLAYYLTQTSQSMGAGDWFMIQLGINDLYGVANSRSVEDAEARVQAMKTKLQFVIDNIHSYNAGIKIGISITIPPASEQDATSNLLQSAYYNKEAYHKIGLKLWWEAVLAEFQNQSDVVLIPTNAVLDTENNFQRNGTNKFFVNNITVAPVEGTIYTLNGYRFRIDEIFVNNKVGCITSRSLANIPKQGTLTKVAGTGDDSIEFYNVEYQPTSVELMQVDDVHPSYLGYKQMADAYIGAIKYFG